MKRKINSLSVSYMLFLILLFLSGSMSGVLSDAVYILAFVLPFLLTLLDAKDEGGDKMRYFKLDSDGVKLTLLSSAPTILIVLSLSALTSLLIKLTIGATNSVELGNSPVLALISHAIVPAVLEELLFRYLPLRLLTGHSKRATVLVSAIFFALIHHSLFSIPYAFVAGAIFMIIDIMCDSVWPSVILHLLNNTVSILFIFYSHNSIFLITALSVLEICATVSLIFFILKRKKYLPMLRKSLSVGERMTFNFNMLIFSVFAILVAIISIV